MAEERKVEEPASLGQCLDYEIFSRSWLGYVPSSWLRTLLAKYYAKKTKKKHARYMREKYSAAIVELITKQKTN